MKKLKIKDKSELVVQILENSENLSISSFVLLLWKRNVIERSFEPPIEFIFNFKKGNLKELYDEVSKFVSVLVKDLSIAKYLPHRFEW